MNKRFLLIANPIAGGGRGRIAAPRLHDALIALGCESELYFTKKSGDATDRAAAVERDEFDGVVAVGGDGTLNEVLAGLPDPSVPLGIQAVGTANVMALELKLPRRPEELAKILRDGKTIESAIGLVTGREHESSRRFLLFVSSGLDARIVERVTEVRTGTQGKLKYLSPILHVVRRWQVEPLRFTTAQGESHDNLSAVVVTRAKSYAGVLRFPGDIKLEDGLLHVLAFRQTTRWQYFRASLRALTGQLRPGRDVICLQTTGVKIECDHTPWQIDGELGGHGSVEIELDPRRARLFVP